MPVLVTSKFDKDLIKTEGVSVATWFSPLCQWQLSVAMTATVLIESALKPKSNLFPISLMIHIKFDLDWPTDLGDFIINLLKI